MLPLLLLLCMLMITSLPVTTFQLSILLNNILIKVFGIKDLGHLHFFLGIEIGYIPEGITKNQHKFTQELLRDSGITVFKPTVTHYLSTLNFSKIPLHHF